MRKLTVFIVSVIAVSLAFTSCKKEEERESMFTLNNIDHPTDHGYYYSGTYSATQSVHLMFLCSPEFDYSETEILTGYGDMVLIAVVSNSLEELLAGTYSSSTTLEALVILNYDDDLDEGVYYNQSSSGISTADITVSGDIFEIEYSLVLATGSTATGYYKGTLEELSSVSLKSMSVTLSE